MNDKNWAEREIELACESERKNVAKPEDADYGITCYNSALRAYQSLMQDGHSDFSIHVTKNILNRLIDGKCLTPIEDIPDVWEDVSRLFSKDDPIKHYQCTRTSSLFKEVAPDGTVTYDDVTRVEVANESKPDVTYTFTFISKLINKLEPITMPYYASDKKFKVIVEEFLVDPMGIDSDTLGCLYYITPEGKKVDLNMYFKDDGNDMVQIDKAEYDERKARMVKESRYDFD